MALVVEKATEPVDTLRSPVRCHSLDVSRDKNQKTCRSMLNKNGVPLKAVNMLMWKFKDYAAVLVINASPGTQ